MSRLSDVDVGFGQQFFVAMVNAILRIQYCSQYSAWRTTATLITSELATRYTATMTDHADEIMEVEQSDEHLVEEDAKLFGTLNADLADAMSHELATKIRSSVMASMPMAHESRVGKLVNHHLLPCYNRGVDVAEVYARRNVFSIAMYPPRRRAVIMEQFFVNNNNQSLDDKEEDENNDMEMEEVITEDERITAARSLLLQTTNNDENQNPHDALEKLTVETNQLQDRLYATQLRRAAMQQSLEHTEMAAALAQKALDSDPAKISLETINAVVEAVPLLLRRQDEAKALIHEMEKREKGRSAEEIQDAEQVMLKKVIPQKRLGLLDQYERDLHQIGGDVTKLDWLQQLLVKSSDH